VKLYEREWYRSTEDPGCYTSGDYYNLLCINGVNHLFRLPPDTQRFKLSIYSHPVKGSKRVTFYLRPCGAPAIKFSGQSSGYLWSWLKPFFKNRTHIYAVVEDPS